MLKVIKLTVGEMASNCYLVYDEKTRETFIIDPGDSADYIESTISRLNLKPIGLIGTHGHSDHLMAATEIKLAYQIDFYLNKKDSLFLYQKGEIPFPKIDHDLGGLKALKLSDFVFRVIQTAGHTPGGVCLYCPKEKIVFVGDLIFAEGGIGRFDFPYSQKEKLFASIKKILKLPFETLVFPGHGEPFYLKEAVKLVKLT